MRKNKQGISLIVLVITIIVMVILAAAIIISLENTGIIGAAENAVCKTNIKQAQNLAVLVWSNIYTNPDEYTMDNVEDKLKAEFEKNGLKYEDYNIEVTKNGINVSSKAGCTDSSGVEGESGNTGSDVVPTNWDYAYSYNRTEDNWTAFLENVGTEITGDIIVRLYKNGNAEFQGVKFDTFDMIVTGTGAFDSSSSSYEDIVTFPVEGTDNKLPAAMCTINLEIQEGITSIGEFMFEGSDYEELNFLKSVKLPDSLETIGNYTFSRQINLENIYFGTGLQKIGDSAFAQCNKLEEIIITEGVTTIGRSAFIDSSALKTLKLPDSLITIGASAFGNCTSLKEITIPKNVTILGTSGSTAGTFNNCTSLRKVNILGSLTSWTAAFKNCTSLSEVYLSEDITIIDNESFDGCKSLATIELPKSLTKIGDYAFNKCSILTGVQIPENVKNIGSVAFGSCTAITEIIIPEGITIINSFSGCSSLKKVTLPSTLTSIGRLYWMHFTRNYNYTRFCYEYRSFGIS